MEKAANVKHCIKDEIYGSAYAAAVYLSSVIKLPETKKVYVIGMAGLEEELSEEGIAHQRTSRWFSKQLRQTNTTIFGDRILEAGTNIWGPQK